MSTGTHPGHRKTSEGDAFDRVSSIQTKETKDASTPRAWEKDGGSQRTRTPGKESEDGEREKKKVAKVDKNLLFAESPTQNLARIHIFSKNGRRWRNEHRPSSSRSSTTYNLSPLSNPESITEVFRGTSDSDLQEWSAAFLDVKPQVILHDRLMTDAALGTVPIKTEHSYSLNSDGDSSPDSPISLDRIDGLVVRLYRLKLPEV
ncbi:hypothetical protein RUM44_008010 [Polyplax serrata]|uniref:PH domain-containing protein n=1 Tax=Polyplax serrata TaxID=468196 RepID=A0ABR1BBZ0_POLSC